MGAESHEEEIRRGSNCYIREFDTPARRTLRSADGMNAAFRRHFEGQFTSEPSLCDEDFRSYLTEFHRLSPTEATSREDEITVG